MSGAEWYRIATRHWKRDLVLAVAAVVVMLALLWVDPAVRGCLTPACL